MKKVIALTSTIILTLCLTFSFSPMTAFAADTTISSNGTYDISSFDDNSTVKVGTNLTVELTNATKIVDKNIMIFCEEGVQLTIKDVNISSSGCALSFSGAGNYLTLSGDNVLSSTDQPGIRVEDTTELTIMGDGSLTVTGGENSAGIGSGHYKLYGTIIITDDVSIISRGGYNGAGLGAGAKYKTTGGNGDTINISGGYVKAIGGNYGAGIGGGGVSTYKGSGGSNGTLNVSGGEVRAFGGTWAAGIGAGGSGTGNSGSCGIVNISGGIVVAKGGSWYGSGIGAGYHGESGTVTISGGIVYASKGNSTDSIVKDIGGGYFGTDPVFYLLDDAILFLANNKTATPITEHHENMPRAYADSNGYLYGEKLPYGTRAGAYIIKSTLTYSLNGELGTAPEDYIFHTPGLVTAPYNDSLDVEDKYVVSWNTQPDATDSGYVPGSLVYCAGDTTLYAIYGDKDVKTIDIQAQNLTLIQGDTCKLTAKVMPEDATKKNVLWTTSDASVAAISDDGLVAAIGEGTAIIYATADGVTDSRSVDVSAKSVSTISLNYGTKSVYEGDTFALSAIVLPDDATYPEVTWKSSDNSVATVNGSAAA